MVVVAVGQQVVDHDRARGPVAQSRRHVQVAAAGPQHRLAFGPYAAGVDGQRMRRGAGDGVAEMAGEAVRDVHPWFWRWTDDDDPGAGRTYLADGVGQPGDPVRPVHSKSVDVAVVAGRA